MLFRHRIIFVSLCVLLIAGNASAQSQPPAPSPATSNQQKQSKSTKTEPPPSNDLRGTYESPLVINVLPTPNADEIAKRKREQEEEKSTLDRWLTGATVALAVITFFLALYTARLWSATKESSQRQLRAYLSVVPQIDHVQFGQMPIARVLIENCGQTPAYQLTQVSGLAWGTTFDTLPPPVGPSGVSMAPLAPRGKNEIPIKSI
ncbi:MAG TPA: hypothetical protein VLY45_04080 [Nitrospiria bacterium]|nr:hypothetical protein [Nitrospiria bacterium]